jgi:dTDP-4-dehydrorhamnose reductase
LNILITGCKGQLGQEFKRFKETFDGNLILTDSDEIDICSLENINNYLSGIELDYIVNCAAYTNVKKSEIEREKSLLINSFGVKNLVDYCEENNTKLIHISTDYVYNSDSINAIDEESEVDPVNYYGFSKREGEKHIEESKSESIVIRTSWLYSKFGKNFVNTMIDKCINKSEISVVDDQFGCPTYAKDLANDILKIIKLNTSLNFENKIFNYSNLSYTNWYDFAQTIKSICGFNNLINPVSTSFYKNDVKRPKFSVTSKQKIIDTFNLEINNWDSSLANYIINDLK